LICGAGAGQGWTDRERNEETLLSVNEERNILRTVKRRKANWFGHILNGNCFLKLVTEGKIEGRIEVTGRRGRRPKQLLDDLTETRGYWILKEALNLTLWRIRFGRELRTIVKTDYGII
jgi:hypothetical protein